MADAGDNDHQHGKHGWVQQQTEASRPRNEARREQRREFRNEKSGSPTDGRGAIKINPPNSRHSNPIHKAAMAAQNPKPAEKTPISTDEEAPSEKTPQHEINKTAAIVGVVAVVALLLLAPR